MRRGRRAAHHMEIAMPSSIPLSFGISCLHYEWETLPEAFARAQDEFGIDAIEFSTNRLDGDDYAACRRLAADRGMTVDLHAWDNLAADAAAGVEAMQRTLDQCAAAGVRHLIVHLGSHPDRRAGIDNVIAVCADAAPAYEQANVVICVENHYLFDYKDLHEIGGEPSDFHALFAAVSSPALRFNLDYGHSHMSGNTDAFIDELKDFLAYTHIADNLGEHDDHLAWRDGTVPWESVLRRTLATGFRGPFVIEFPEWKGGAGRFREFMDFLRRLDEEADESP